MNLNIDTGKIATALLTAGILAFVGGVFEFRGLKAQVKVNTKQIGVASKLLCKYAIRDKLKDAEEICSEIISGSK